MNIIAIKPFQRMTPLFKKIFLMIFIVVLGVNGFSQSTMGVISYDKDAGFSGYNLIYPHNQPNIYLLNACGQIVHQWSDEPEFRPGNSAYLLENGNVLKTKRPPNSIANTNISAGGAGGIIELRDWDNNLIWNYSVVDSTRRAHHDIAPMPNGNVLVVAWENKSVEQVVQAGRDTSLFEDVGLWPDMILEIDSDKDSIVWEWHAWDHLIQEFNDTKDNYGIVVDHPELIDINFDLDGFGGRNDWMHVNSIDYNEDLDQIIISVPFFNEVWILDHSTTTEEAKGHTGGNSGMGGDIIYRWGNPRTYKRGDTLDQKLFFQHDVHWNDNFISDDHPFYGKIALFNNRFGGNYSIANVITPDWDKESRRYAMEDGTFLPSDYDISITHPDTFPMFSSGLSSVQFLNNNNVLLNVGRKGYAFELTMENDIVWEYITPLNDGNPLTQGQELPPELNNNTFRMTRYPADYMAFQDRDLEPQGFIELNPDVFFCTLLGTNTSDINSSINVKVYPNPASEFFYLEMDDLDNINLSIYDLYGNIVLSKIGVNNNEKINVMDYNIPPGVYILKINDLFGGKMVISH